MHVMLKGVCFRVSGTRWSARSPNDVFAEVFVRGIDAETGDACPTLAMMQNPAITDLESVHCT